MLTAHQSHVALGCNIQLLLVVNSNKVSIDEYFRRLWLYIFEFENKFSRFLPDSELSRFNRSAGTRQRISSEFKDLLQSAIKMTEISNGMFNPFVLPAVQRAGYVHSMLSGHDKDYVDDFSNRYIVSPNNLLLFENEAEIPYGTALDSGGIGKGYAGDKLAEMAASFDEINGYWFSLGGDVIAEGSDESGNPWEVLISASDKSDTTDAVVRASKSRIAVATSSAIRRSKLEDGLVVRHIIDPMTGLPTESDIEYASASATNLTVADILASCLIIGGEAAAKKYTDKKIISGAMLKSKTSKMFFGDEMKTYN